MHKKNRTKFKVKHKTLLTFERSQKFSCDPRYRSQNFPIYLDEIFVSSGSGNAAIIKAFKRRRVALHLDSLGRYGPTIPQLEVARLAFEALGNAYDTYYADAE